MLTAYHVSLPHGKRGWWRVASGLPHFDAALLRYTWRRELFFICYRRFGSGSVGIRDITSLGYHSAVSRFGIAVPR
jgi:hypothetical protein